MKRKTKKTKKIKKIRKIKKRLSGQPAKSQELVHKTRMRVIGIGGGGGSIVSEIASQIKKIDFVVVNTDLQALKDLKKKVRIFPCGQSFTRGLGCGMDAKLGQKAARAEKDKIAKLFQGIDLVILVSSLGGGMGSGAAPEFAKIAKDLGLIVFGIFTLPFKFEGGKRAQIAKASLEKLIPYLNTVSIIPNENIFQIIDQKTPILEAFSAVNRRLTENLRGLCEMVFLPGLINIDFADLKTILDGKGKLAYLNSATAQGPNRSEETLKELLKSPLNEYSIQGAEKIIFNITASQDLTMKEVEKISKTIADFNRRAKIIFGVSQDNAYKDKIRITLLAVGCGKEPRRKVVPKKVEPKPVVPESRENPPAPKSKPKPKPKPKPKSRIQVKSNPPVANPALTRRNALDLKKVVEKTEQDFLAQEAKWDMPAFLRKQTEEK